MTGASFWDDENIPALDGGDVSTALNTLKTLACTLYFFNFYFGCTTRHVRSQFSDQGLNPESAEPSCGAIREGL